MFLVFNFFINYKYIYISSQNYTEIQFNKLFSILLSGFHYDVFIHAYNVLQSHSPPSPPK
jgi:predicted AlkP superfamily pyrophosphatase or phosphodiesterase